MATIDTNMSLVMIDPNEPLELYDGTIIKGRLEWFLYALCCLDYGNLPTPLSRIEEWANALITNELPNMEPQSRAEEFFKAILTGDTSNLPTPQSRSEVLLDKLARGENDFTNVEKIQSRYEFLLAYLIKNGGGIGNIDYVLYKFQKEDETLYNTKERPVKSAILSGQTLVNLHKLENYSSFGVLLDEGMQSVKMPVLTTTGKNLINIKKAERRGSTKCSLINNGDGSITLVGDGDGSGEGILTTTCYAHLKQGKTYTFSFESDGQYSNTNATDTVEAFLLKDGSASTRIIQMKGFTTTFTCQEDGDYYVRFDVNKNDTTHRFWNVQLTEGSTVYPYEPYKSNILSTSEDVVLRGIGEVRDTLDCLTGEVTERIGEVVFDGSDDENWSIPTNFSNGDCKGYSLSVDDLTSNIVCDGLKILPNSLKYGTEEGVFVSNNLLIVKKNISTRELFKEWLSNNPITVQYELATPVVKTVDLSIVDQGGATIPKLKTFDKITHVNVSATDILPGEVEMEVATTIGEDLSGTLYSTMEDIETKQEALKESNNAQTESINSTMMGTTEIYESLL